MKKLIKTLLVATLFTVMLGGSALAAFTGGIHPSDNAGARLHGDFGSNTSGCAGCHVTHNADAKKLLKYGPTQTAFCVNCHNNGGNSPYDVVNGKIQADADVDANWSLGTFAVSYSGGFGFFTSSSLSASYTDAKGFTSIHNVENKTVEDTGETNIPGSDKGILSGLKCASCHNPHRGGLEARLLREDLVTTGGTVSVSAPVMDIATDTNLPTAYVSGFSGWCGGCHDKFNRGNDAGHDKTGDSGNMYRHAMGVTPPDSGSIANTSLSNGTPLENGKVSCLTCHRAHGSKATVNGVAESFGDGEGTHYGSALLRMNNRDVCYNCHGAAQYNLAATN